MNSKTSRTIRLLERIGNSTLQLPKPHTIASSPSKSPAAAAPELVAAADALKDALAQYPGVHDIRDSFHEGKQELSLRILPAEVMPGLVHRLDLHARQVQVSEMLGGAARRFQIARQIAQLEQREGIETVVAGANLASPEARGLFKEHVTDYAASALLMPYGRFLRACERTGYDLAVLTRRFTVSFDQLAQRLTTLQRVGQRGLPFFSARFGRTGRMTDFTAGASVAAHPLEGARWPAWAPYAAFEARGTMLAQAVTFGEGEGAARHWFTIASTVEVDSAACSARRAVVLGVEARFAGELADARGISLDPQDAVALGTGCPRCGRIDCLTPASARMALEERG